MRTLRKTLLRGAWALALGVVSAVAQPAKSLRSLPLCNADGQKITLTLNTGTAGGFPPPGTADPIWTIVQPTPMTPFTTSAFSSPTLWLPNSVTQKWIQPASSGTPATFPIATYVYSTQFTTPVDPYLYTSITISGNFAADIAVVKLNGVTIATSNAPLPPSVATAPFHVWTSIPAVVGWQTFNRFSPFLNTLTVEVQNKIANSVSGLMVQGRVVAVCSKCTSPVPPPEPPALPCSGNPSTC